MLASEVSRSMASRSMASYWSVVSGMCRMCGYFRFIGMELLSSLIVDILSGEIGSPSRNPKNIFGTLTGAATDHHHGP
jgi:hypothetical protein